jgi:hypothetical protein
MTSSSMPVRARTRARNRSPFSARRQASVATALDRVTRRQRILSAQTLSAFKVRSMAASDSRPLAAIPSPRRTIREKASMTRNPWFCGRATSRRQLLVPRSTAP